MNVQLELTLLTNHEKLELMTCTPVKQTVESVKREILNKRKFNDKHSLHVFSEELDKLGQSRSHGVPKKMKKVSHYLTK